MEEKISLYPFWFDKIQYASMPSIDSIILLESWKGITINAVAQASAVIQSEANTETLKIFDWNDFPFFGLIVWTYFFPVSESILYFL